MTERVFVVRGGGPYYHTREDCMHLQAANSLRTADVDVLGDHIEECRTCQNGGRPPQTTQGWDHFNSLRRAAKDAEGASE